MKPSPFTRSPFANDLAIYTEHPDKRRTYDIRREIVCTGIFNVWDEAGRPLSFTTDPITSRRGGPLPEFVNTVVACITEPSSTLSGEAIRTEIDRYKSHIASDAGECIDPRQKNLITTLMNDPLGSAWSRHAASTLTYRQAP